MELRPGYKQTEVGVIPEDWEVRRLGDLGKIVRGGSPRPAGDPRYFDGTFIPWLTVTSLTNIPDSQLFVAETATKLTEDGSNYSRTLQAGTLVMVNSGARTLGVTKILSITCCANDGIAALVNHRGVDTRFLCHYLNSQIRRLREVVAAGNDQLNLNTQRIALIGVPFPKPTEQHAIAETLSNADAHVDSLHHLIAKKRDLKRGAMQELLRPKPGWVMRRLGSVLSFQVGFPFSSILFNTEGQGLRLVRNRDLKGDDQVVYYSGTFDSVFTVKNGDVLVGMDGEFLPCLWNKGEALLNQRVGRIIRSVGVDLVFAYYFLAGPLKEIETVTSSTTVKHLSHGDIVDVERPLPCLAEQAAIAAILSDMDAELAALEAKLTKARQIKQGMMHNLLAGRIRLV